MEREKNLLLYIIHRNEILNNIIYLQYAVSIHLTVMRIKLIFEIKSTF